MAGSTGTRLSMEEEKDEEEEDDVKKSVNKHHWVRVYETFCDRRQRYDTALSQTGNGLIDNRQIGVLFGRKGIFASGEKN